MVDRLDNMMIIIIFIIIITSSNFAKSFKHLLQFYNTKLFSLNVVSRLKFLSFIACISDYGSVTMTCNRSKT